jgi:hypothetical protein
MTEESEEIINLIKTTANRTGEDYLQKLPLFAELFSLMAKRKSKSAKNRGDET